MNIDACNDILEQRTHLIDDLNALNIQIDGLPALSTYHCSVSNGGAVYVIPEDTLCKTIAKAGIIYDKDKKMFVDMLASKNCLYEHAFSLKCRYLAFTEEDENKFIAATTVCC